MIPKITGHIEMPLSLMVSSTTLLPKLLVTWQHASPQSMPNRMQIADSLLIAYRMVFIVIGMAFVINLSDMWRDVDLRVG